MIPCLARLFTLKVSKTWTHTLAAFPLDLTPLSMYILNVSFQFFLYIYVSVFMCIHLLHACIWRLGGISCLQEVLGFELKSSGLMEYTFTCQVISMAHLKKKLCVCIYICVCVSVFLVWIPMGVRRDSLWAGVTDGWNPPSVSAGN